MEEGLKTKNKIYTERQMREEWEQKNKIFKEKQELENINKQLHASNNFRIKNFVRMLIESRAHSLWLELQIEGYGLDVEKAVKFFSSSRGRDEQA